VSQALTVTLPAEEAPAKTFADLYRDSVHDLFAYVATMLQDRSAAEDVVAQAFERAYRKRRTFDRRRGNERAWLFGIARNAALDELRRRKRTTALIAEPGEIASADDPELLARRVTVRDALNRMEPRDRELIALKFHGGLNNGEIAKLLGTSESNVGTRLHRAVTKLREACDA
jgi:RNA polymerase sigma-70 factor, ECF subfamily